MSNPTMKEVWIERHGTDYYHFIYRDVLFMVLNTEESRPAPPPDIHEKTLLYKRLLVEDPAAAKAMLEEFMSSKSVVAGLGQAVEFSDTQVAWVKNRSTPSG